VNRPRLEVFFDYISPFAYFASELVAPLAQRHGAEVAWRPLELLRLSPFANGAPYSPAKRAYVVQDVLRTAEMREIPIATPEPFPVQSTLALRVTLAARDTELFDSLRPLLFRAAWLEQRDLADEGVLADCIARAGGDPVTLLEHARREATRAELDALTAQAESRGVFGVPSVFLGSELFWGVDSFPALEWRLAAQRVRRAGC
jgi:2-hydroxychromene-2-carboxylate isomerase